MTGALTPAAIASTVRLLRDAHSGPIILFEGSTDSRVYSRFLDQSSCRSVVAHTRSTVVEVITKLDIEGFSGVLGLLDADFSRLESQLHNSANLLLTDTHDLESMAFRSHALAHVLSELGSRDKIQRVEAALQKNVRTLLLETALPIGYLRWASLRFALNLRFEGLVYSRFVTTRKGLHTDPDSLLRTVRDLSCRHDFSVSPLHEICARLRSADHDPWQVVCGHDLASILSCALRSLLGTRNASEAAPHLVEMALRLSYDLSCFRQSALYRDLKVWEQRTRLHVLVQEP
ncbi:MAG: DUF4435 domain-containing protein [Chloroflexi bacterium]|nr:DUF4435 domain-containing protein [Chloroflexota bacterium]